MSNAVATTNSSVMEQVIAKGNLADLSADQRARYYLEVCQSMGLNPLSKPFEYLTLGRESDRKLVLYATKTATDQLRTVKGVSIFKVDAETVDDIRIVHAYARDSTGREDMDIGAVNIKGLGGEFLANAYMKALTKAKRRVTLSICGLGWMDESEIDTIPNAHRVNVNVETGEIIDSPGDAEVAETEVIDDGVPMITALQLRRMHALKTEKGLTNEQLKAMHGKASAKELTAHEAGMFIGQLVNLPNVIVDEPDGESEQPELLSAPNQDKWTR